MCGLTLSKGVKVIVIENCFLKNNHELIYTVDKLWHLLCCCAWVIVRLGYVLDKLAFN
jgi:hypothetical protein